MRSSNYFVLLLISVAGLAAQTPPAKPPAPKLAPGQPAVKAVPPAGNAPAAAPVAVPPDKVILTIGDEKITAAEFNQLVESLPEQLRAQARGPNKRSFTEQLIRIKLLAKEAKRRKLDQAPMIRTQMELQQDNLLAGALFQDIQNNTKIDDAELRKYYDEHKSDNEQVRARHILIRMKGSPVPAGKDKKELTEEEALAKAQDIRKKLLAGEDFATLAKAESDDTGSAANGGDLNFFKRGQMVGPFEQAAFTLPVGQVSEPVKSQFGYHIIKVEQHDTKTFDEVKPELEKKLRPEVARKAVEDLRKTAQVTMDETFFGPPPVALQTPR